ncbi:MAG: GldG family protein, partial [Deltaproteobacteria bacterium]|nr:GldG family protein [Deltaproteobacteria bacterium]
MTVNAISTSSKQEDVRVSAARTGPPHHSRSRREQAESLSFLVLMGGVLIGLNVLGVFFFTRIDTTATRAFSLSDGSKRVIRNLDETLTITAYFSADLPPPFNSTERYVRDLLAEYQSVGRGKVKVRFVNPDTDREKEEARERGVHLVQHQKLDENAVNVVEGYRGIVFEYMGEREVIPVVQPDTQGLEYEITMAIKRLTGERAPIGIVTGHEGPTLGRGLSTLQKMLATYNLREVDAKQEIDTSLRALLIIDPQTELSETELRRINQYVMRGGSLGVFGGSMKADISLAPTITATPSRSNINRLLQAWGIEMGENIVADARCGRVPLRTSFGLAIPVPYPPAPIVTFSEEQSKHPVLFRLPASPLFFVSAIKTKDEFKKLGGKVLMESSGGQASWLLTGSSIDLSIRDPREWRNTLKGESGPHVLAVAIEAQLPSAFPDAGDSGIEAPPRSTTPQEGDEDKVRVLVVGTSTPLRDEFLPQGEQVSKGELAGAMAFALNAIDWLAQDSDLIAIRAKSIEEPPLEVPQSIQEATRAALESAQAGDEEGVAEALERRKAALEAENARKLWYQYG